MDGCHSVPFLLAYVPVQWRVQLSYLRCNWHHEMVQSQVRTPYNTRREVLAVLLGGDLGRRGVLTLLATLLLYDSTLLLLGELDHRVTDCLVQVNVTALLGQEVAAPCLLVEVLQVRLGLAWCLLHNHICPGVLLKECADGHVSVPDLVLEVGEALIAQFRRQTT